MIRDGVKPGQWEGAPFDNLPPDCCIQVVGRDADGVVYCISTTGHMRRMEKWDMPALTDLFAPRLNSLMFWWPGFGEAKVIEDGEEKKKLVVKRVERDKVMMCLIREASRRDFDPNTQHRGRGGWQDGQGSFVWHSGNWLWRVEGTKLTRARPTFYDGFLYTRMAGTVEPWMEPVTPEESPARRILETLRTWNWQRPYLDPILVLGWIGVALMGGALKARPILFTTGGAGVGKSTLLELLRNSLHGAVTATVNTTAAGIYQRAKTDSLPFLVDELEAKAGSSRAESVIELARVAYTGGDISRGGQDHEATTFTARNAFGFFAINAPPMGAQDKTRMALLNLARLDRPNGLGQAPEMSPDTDCRMMLRQIMDGWRDLQARLIPQYWGELAPHGLDSRAIDTFGTLLAAAELLVGTDAIQDVMGRSDAEDMAIGEIVAAATALERAERLDNWHECLDHLLQSAIDAWRDGVKPTIGGVCENLRINTMDLKFAQERLQLVNLSAKERGKVPNCGPLLAVPADGPVLRRIFGDTKFLDGVWFNALKGAPADIVLRDLGPAQKVKINGSTKHCLLVDLDAFERFTATADD